MKTYKYKIQWLLNVDTDNYQYLIKILGHRSFTEISFRDSNLNIIQTFDTISYSSSDYNLVRKEIKKIIKNNENIYFIELLRK